MNIHANRCEAAAPKTHHSPIFPDAQTPQMRTRAHMAPASSTVRGLPDGSPPAVSAIRHARLPPDMLESAPAAADAQQARAPDRQRSITRRYILPRDVCCRYRRLAAGLFMPFISRALIMMRASRVLRQPSANQRCCALNGALFIRHYLPRRVYAASALAKMPTCLRR